MFLKAVEIRGFKSFADKTEVELKNGITAIVGPNGSGKSNISDAVRWVLGEQSVKSLRGGKMEDVIFAGTQFRKPLGLAQVALILDNSDNDLSIDYSQVTISRRLFRSGESEYYINNTKCRLKDIQELFMDTGVGKEGYSIIGQGKIEALLSGNIEERRELLEEAAGIVKFKSRKHEAEKKLENTEQNLIRINDILMTYEERLPHLEEENKKAKEFLRFSEELKEKEVSLIIDNCENIKEIIKENENNFEKNSHELTKLNNEKETKSNILDEYSNNLEEIEQRFVNENKRYYDKKTEIQELNSENLLFKERIENSSKKISENTEIVKELFNELELLRQNKEIITITTEEHKSMLNKIQQNIFNLEGELREAEKELLNRDNKLKNISQEIFKLEEEKLLINNKTIEINSSINNFQSKIKAIDISVENFVNSIKVNSITINEIKRELNLLKETTEALKLKKEEKKKELANLQRKSTLKQKSLRELTFQLNNLENNKKMLINLEEHYEGYNKAVKLLMTDIKEKKVRNFNNDATLLGEVVDVESKYETAIEVALSSSISNVIVNDEKDAQRLIEHLKINKLGRVTFLPLTILKSSVVNVANNITAIKGYVGIASELVKYDEKYKKAIEFSLGRILICENIDSGLEIAKKSNYSYRIVTLDGEVLNIGGSLTGGSLYKKNINVLGRKKEIETLSEKIKSTNEDIISVSKEIELINIEIKNADEEIINNTNELHNLEIENIKLLERIKSLDMENSKNNLALENSKNEKIMITSELNNLKLEYDNLFEKLNNLLINKDKLEKYIKEHESEKDSVIRGLSEKKEKATQYRIEEAKIKEICENDNNKILTLNESEISLENKINNNKAIIEEETKTKDTNEKNLIKNSEIVKQFNEEISVLEKAFKDIDLKKYEIKNKISAIKNEINDLDAIISKKVEQKNKVEIFLTKKQSELENLLQKLNEEYDITYAEALQYKVTIDDKNGLIERINTLKKSISAIGTVNLGAIEEFEEIKEKYVFLDKQREDLISSKDELIKVIYEMTSKMREVFKENFETLRKIFDETFKELFKGGTADLVINGEDVLTAPIEIHVQPPGKRLQNINLMSGGEKGLSAIALLFSILKMKPSPFCILDEIEAALDDANVLRFAEFLKKFSGKTQFIVITHRKGTMEASDILYGVTMEEKGVSKLVSVDLKM